MKGDILVVEDDIVIANLIETRLNNLGYSVKGIVSRGDEAVAKVTELQPDLVLMDIKLEGDIDGIAAAKMIKHTKNVPIIYLTSYFDDNTLDKAKKTQPEGFIIKPFTDADLRTTIEIALFKTQR